jgi:hypothetical protein
MATVASVAQGWDSQSSRLIRGVVALRISAANSLVQAQTGNGDGFGQLGPIENELVFAVPQLLDSDDVLGAQLVGPESTSKIRIVSCIRTASGASPTVSCLFYSLNGGDDAALDADPVIIDIYVARR